MRLSSVLVPVLPLAAALVLAGCGGSSAGEGSGNGAGGPTLTGPASSAATAVPTETTGVPTPDAAEQAALLGALAAIDPNLASDPTDAVSNAVSLCAALQDGDAPADAVASTFPDVQLDAAQAQTLVQAVTQGFCTLGGAGAGASAPTSTGSASASPTAS